ncbi:hypothetical protein KXD40_009352 [Peronospora effusa]|uniref:RxLR effector PexRD54 WY domain-containing protein n=1 Tax=Peronospora effusa TaxID=542832 RepID=A0A3M6V6J0_9STRA|nr:hypothetical protein DD238_008516 [Peronospora effusa]RQM09322.1 hypothetical protein DD237_008577 [Peronospora effusa]UIZ28503.1 hypothetical protein KXD40_009352 [Peronospora effusa]CAI5729851.1 unnamed protein product [Peronospora effusa]
MHLPCVLILFAAVTRPEGVGAHVEPSDVVTSDGQVDFQRHLRVQKRAHGKDKEERMNSLNFGEKFISSNALEHAAEEFGIPILNSKPLDGASDTLNTVKRPADILEPEKRLAKKPFNTFKRPADRLPEKNIRENLLKLATTEDMPNTILLKNANYLDMQKDPVEVFKLYGLQTAKDELFGKPEMKYWVHYMIGFIAKYEPTNNRLFDILLNFYTTRDLAKVVVMYPNDKIALHVLDEMEVAFLIHYNPDQAFEFLHLQQAGDKLFDNRLFIFWTKYVIYYNKRKANKNVSMLSVLEKHFDLLTLLDQIKLKQNSDITKHLMKEIKDAGMENLNI